MPKKESPKEKKTKSKKSTPTKKPSKSNKSKKKSNGLKTYWMVYRVVAQAVKEEKLPWKYQRIRKFSTERVYPYFKGKNPNQITTDEIKSIAYSLLGKTSEFYNPLLIRASFTTGIFWFDLDEFLEVSLRAEVDPLNLRFAIDAGKFGNTGIITIKDYEFFISGLQEIYENIRAEIDNESDAEWSGIAVLRDGYTDDGKADSYYLRFTLFINGEEIEPSMEREFGTAKVDFGKLEDRKKKRKAFVAKQKELSQKRRELEKQKKIKQAFLPTKKVRKGEKEESKEIIKMRGENIQSALKEQRELLQDTERLYKEGILTKAEFIAERKQILETYREAIKRFEKGGTL